MEGGGGVCAVVVSSKRGDKEGRKRSLRRKGRRMDGWMERHRRRERINGKKGRDIFRKYDIL